MILLKVVFGVEGIEKGKAFMYFPTMKEANRWIKEESPHELCLEYDQDIEKVDIPTTKKGFCDHLNEHHCYW